MSIAKILVGKKLKKSSNMHLYNRKLKIVLASKRTNFALQLTGNWKIFQAAIDI